MGSLRGGEGEEDTARVSMARRGSGDVCPARPRRMISPVLRRNSTPGFLDDSERTHQRQSQEDQENQDDQDDQSHAQMEEMPLTSRYASATSSDNGDPNDFAPMVPKREPSLTLFQDSTSCMIVDKANGNITTCSASFMELGMFSPPGRKKQTSKLQTETIAEDVAPDLPAEAQTPQIEQSTAAVENTATGKTVPKSKQKLPDSFFSPEVNTKGQSSTKKQLSPVFSVAEYEVSTNFGDSSADSFHCDAYVPPKKKEKNTYGYEEAAPDIARKNDVSSAAKYGYEAAEPDISNANKYGYEDAQPDLAKKNSTAYADNDSHKRVFSSRRRRASSMDHMHSMLKSSMKGRNRERRPGKTRDGKLHRAISFSEEMKVHEVTPIAKEYKQDIWFQSNEKKLMKKNLLKAVQGAKSGGMDSTYHGCGQGGSGSASSSSMDDSFCLRGIEVYMDDVAKWRNKTIGNLYDMVLDAQSIQRRSDYRDDVQLAGFSEQISEESRRLAVERALHDAMMVGTLEPCHRGRARRSFSMF